MDCVRVCWLCCDVERDNDKCCVSPSAGGMDHARLAATLQDLRCGTCMYYAMSANFIIHLVVRHLYSALVSGKCWLALLLLWNLRATTLMLSILRCTHRSQELHKAAATVQQPSTSAAAAGTCPPLAEHFFSGRHRAASDQV